MTSQPGLGGGDAVLRDPTQQSLSALAALLSHPRLAPLSIDFTRPLTPASWR